MPIFAEVLNWRQLRKSDTTQANSKLITPPSQGEYYISALYVTYTSSGTAGNRQLAVELLAEDGSTVMLRMLVGLVQAASLTYNYLIAPGVGDLTAARDTTFLTTPLPPTLIIPPKFTIKIYDKANIHAAGDTLAYQAFLAVRPA